MTSGKGKVGVEKSLQDDSGNSKLEEDEKRVRRKEAENEQRYNENRELEKQKMEEKIAHGDTPVVASFLLPFIVWHSLQMSLSLHAFIFLLNYHYLCLLVCILLISFTLSPPPSSQLYHHPQALRLCCLAASWRKRNSSYKYFKLIKKDGRRIGIGDYPCKILQEICHDAVKEIWETERFLKNILQF